MKNGGHVTRIPSPLDLIHRRYRFCATKCSIAAASVCGRTAGCPSADPRLFRDQGGVLPSPSIPSHRLKPLTHRRRIVDHPTHRRVEVQPLGTIHILVTGRPPEYRLPQPSEKKWRRSCWYAPRRISLHRMSSEYACQRQIVGLPPNCHRADRVGCSATQSALATHASTGCSTSGSRLPAVPGHPDQETSTFPHLARLAYPRAPWNLSSALSTVGAPICWSLGGPRHRVARVGGCFLSRPAYRREYQ